MVSVGSIVSGAFGLIRERPLAVIFWGVIYTAVSVLLGLAMQSQMQTVAAGPLAATPVSSMLGTMLLLQLGFMIVFTILMTASIRAVLRPWDKGLFHIRFGLDELRMIGLVLLYAMAFYFGLVVAVMFVGLLALIFAFASPVLAIIMMIVGGVAVAVVAIWLSVRLSLSYPLTLLRERFVIGESWTLTGGRFWTLFGGYLAIFLFLLVVSVLLGLATNGSYLLEFVRGGFSSESWQAASQKQLADQFGEITALTVLGWALGSVSGSLYISLSGAAVATATKELATDQDALVREFS